MYIELLQLVSGLLPPYRTTLFSDNDKRVKSWQGGGLPATTGEIHFPNNKECNNDYHRCNLAVLT